MLLFGLMVTKYILVVMGMKLCTGLIGEITVIHLKYPLV
jgi:hypothetical protein